MIGHSEASKDHGNVERT